MGKRYRFRSRGNMIILLLLYLYSKKTQKTAVFTTEKHTDLHNGSKVLLSSPVIFIRLKQRICKAL